MQRLARPLPNGEGRDAFLFAAPAGLFHAKAKLFVAMITTELPDENAILHKQIVPRTQRVLYVLRISLCVVAGLLAFAKLNLIPPMSSFYVDVFSDRTLDLRPGVQALNILVSGLLAAFLALIIATFLIQARVKASAQNRQHEGQDQP